MTAQPASLHSPRFAHLPKVGLLGALCVGLTMMLGGCSSPETVDDHTGADAATGDVQQADGEGADTTPVEVQQIRVATYNTSLFRSTDGGLLQGLTGGEDAQARKVAELIQRVRPDIVLLNEFDWDADGESAKIFMRDYLSVDQNGAGAIEYAHHYIPTTNTGIPSGVDLNNKDGVVMTPGSRGYGDDAFGFGQFPGQYGMVVLSRFPIKADQVRTFQNFLWRDMPDNLQPTDWYSAEAVDVMRLSSKNHADVAIDVGGTPLHLLISHPTPPSFDGPEDRNGRRNHDEIRVWVDYISGAEQSAYLTDDSGVSGGLGDEAFVLLGDLNSDPNDGNSRREALLGLLSHPRVQDPKPTSDGAVEANERDGRVNTAHTGDPALDTADFNDNSVGNLRVDYALASADLTVVDKGVFWPASDAEHADLIKISDHHLVWVDVEIEKP
ncbi:endonuclease/exonuclease/phosphatase family protein [Bradymonas sediminis]|nr:endonuclease/exonuclease/phosphatase family protein [Bradymonas sediminis]TDP72239.1 endonuclease/exonuclease/phosphatase family protein [Bradymonas sediminis]